MDLCKQNVRWLRTWRRHLGSAFSHLVWYGRVAVGFVNGKKVTKRFTVCIDVDGLWCTVLCVSSVRQGQGGVEWSAFTLTQFNTRGPCNARVYYYPIRGRHDIIVVTCTWRHALLRFKHVLRTRARRRIASHVCDVLPRIIIDVSLVIASYIV